MTEILADWILLTLVQVLLISLFVGLAANFFRNTHPFVSKTVLNVGNLSMLALLVAFLVPVPSWFSVESMPDEAAQDSLISFDTYRMENDVEPILDQKSNWDFRAQKVKELEASLPVVSEVAVEPQIAKEAVSQRSQFKWLLIGVLFCSGLYGIAVFLRQCLWLGVIYRGSKILDDARIQDTLIQLTKEMKLGTVPEIRVSNQVGIAATFGFFRSVIFVSPRCQELSQQQLASVLSHELTHVQAGDFYFRVLAGICRAVYFFNPVVHWTTRSLLWVQEITCDMQASQWVGGVKKYRRSLAEIALVESGDQGLPMALSFSGSQNKLVSRLERLKDMFSENLKWKNKSLLLRRVLALVTVFCFFSVLGLRPAAEAQQKKESKDKEEKQLNFDFVPKDAAFIFTAKPDKIRKSPKLFPLLEIAPSVAELFSEKGVFQSVTGGEIKDFQQFSIYMIFDEEKLAPGEPVVLFRSKGDVKESIKSIARAEGKVAGKKVWKLKKELPNEFRDWKLLCNFGMVMDSHTVVWARSEELLEKAAKVKKGSSRKADWFKAQKRYDDADLMMIVDDPFLTGVRTQLERNPQLRVSFPIEGMLDSERYILSGKIRKKLDLKVFCQFSKRSTASDFFKEIQSKVSVAKPFIDALADDADERKSTIGEIGQDILKTFKVRRDGKMVLADASVPLRPMTFLSAVTDARRSARKTASMNNMRQLTLAMHNYHSAYGHFPPAVVKHKSGNVHSWRIALLPFLDEAKLYKEYRMDEPWNSPHNKKIVSDMPAVFIHPAADPGVFSSYYIPTGKGTMYPKESETQGISLRKISDGASNTLVLVEAKLNRHWADPKTFTAKDFTSGKNLGGFQEGDTFSGAMADGSVRQFKSDLSMKILKAMLTPSGGEDLSKIE